MKKTFSIVMKSIMQSAAALLLLVVMASCGSKVPSPEAVAAKLDTGEALSQTDYTAMIDYCGEYARNAQKYYDIINAQPNDSTAESIKATDDLASLYGKYKYLDMFRNSLAQTDLSALGADNEKKVNDYAKYQGFPLPVGEGADLQDPNVVGMIEETPDTDSSAVIATGDGEAVDVDVK